MSADPASLLRGICERHFAALPDDYRWREGGAVIAAPEVSEPHGVALTVPASGPFGYAEAMDFGRECLHLARRTHPTLRALNVAVYTKPGAPLAPLPSAPRDVPELDGAAATFVAWLRTAPRRESPLEPLRALASRVAPDLRALLVTLAEYDVESVLPAALSFTPEARASLVRAASGDGLREVVLFHAKGKSPKTYVQSVETHPYPEGWWSGGYLTDEDLPALFDHMRHDLRSMGAAPIERALGEALRKLAKTLPASYAAVQKELSAARGVEHRMREDARRQRARRQASLGIVTVREPTPAERAADTKFRARFARPERNPGELRGLNFTVRFVDDGPIAERVVRVAPDGEERAIELPSRTRYRTRSALSLDGTRLFVASESLVREVDLATLEARVLTEGPGLVSVVALPGERLAVGVRAGRASLSHDDPDAASLPVVRALMAEMLGTYVLATKPGIAVCSTGKNTAPNRWVELPAGVTSMEAIRKGRVLVVQTSAPTSTEPFAVKEGELVPLLRPDTWLGALTEAPGGRVFTDAGTEVLGLDEAWEAAVVG